MFDVLPLKYEFFERASSFSSYKLIDEFKIASNQTILIEFSYVFIDDKCN